MLFRSGAQEPYRMFSSLVEHRTFIRHDNADFRLTSLSHEAGLANNERFLTLQRKRKGISQVRETLATTRLAHKDLGIAASFTPSFNDKKSLMELLKRPELSITYLAEATPVMANIISQFSSEIMKEIEIEIKYEGYITKQKAVLEKRSVLADLSIPANFDYQIIPALSFEGREKLTYIKPLNIAQASMIQGVRQSDLALLISHLKKNYA